MLRQLFTINKRFQSSLRPTVQSKSGLFKQPNKSIFAFGRSNNIVQTSQYAFLKQQPKFFTTDSQASNRVYVGNLSFDIDEPTIREAFKDCGALVNINLITKKDTGRFAGASILEFSSENGAQKALQLNGVDLHGRAIKVELAKPRRGKPETLPLSPKPDGCNTIFIGRLSEQVTDDIIKETFGQFGEIKSIRFLSDKETGEFKGVVFVEFTDPQSVDKAVQLNGQDLLGRSMRIDYATGRKPRQQQEE